MATFKVGQRVRKVCHPHTYGWAEVPIGTEGVIVPNDGRKCCDGMREYDVRYVGFNKQCGAHAYMLEPILGSDNRVTAWEVGVSPWVPEHLREKREQPATVEPGLTK